MFQRMGGIQRIYIGDKCKIVCNSRSHLHCASLREDRKYIFTLKLVNRVNHLKREYSAMIRKAMPLVLVIKR